MKKIKLNDVLFFIAIISVIYLAVVVIYQGQGITYTDERCYNPETRFYEDVTDCSYDEETGIWTCYEGEYKYCF